MFYDNYFVPRGYAVILAEMNGTSNSTGCPLHGGPGDIAGMRSVVDWLNNRAVGRNQGGTQVYPTWHNGSSAMIGKSYDGTLANGVAATGVAGLKTIVPIAAISDWYGYSRQNGIRLNTHYPASLASTVTDASRRAGCLASRNAMSAADGDDTGDRNAFWNDRDYLSQVGNVQASVFVTHGFQDDNVKADQFSTWWAGLGAEGVPRKLWLLRGGHVDPFDSRRTVWMATLHRWFDHWLLGVDNGIMGEPRVDIEDAADDWHTYAEWPIPGSTPTSVYLRAAGATERGRHRPQRGRQRRDADVHEREPERGHADRLADRLAGQPARVPLAAAHPRRAHLRHARGRALRRPVHGAEQPRRGPRRLRRRHAGLAQRRGHHDDRQPHVRGRARRPPTRGATSTSSSGSRRCRTRRRRGA